MIQASSNPFSCTPAIVGSNYSIIQLGTISRNVNDFTFSLGFKWKINNQIFQNLSETVLTINEASFGKKRIDIAILTNQNTIELISGVESESIAIRPIVPDNSILLTEWNIEGSSVGDQNNPIAGIDVVKKSFSLPFGITSTAGGPLSIPLNPNGYSEIRLLDETITSVIGVDLSLISGVTSAEIPYQGKLYILRNLTSNTIVLKNEDPSADIPFYTSNEQDIYIPSKGTLIFRYDPAACEVLIKGWDIDVSTKADLVGGKVPASQLPSYVDDVLEYANLASFPATGESGKLYIALDTNYIYRWSGSAYIVFSTTPALPGNDGKIYGIKNGIWSEVTVASDYIVTMHHPSWNCLTQNQWRRWQVNASSILADSDNGSIGTGTTPDSSIYYACNVLKVTNKTQLKSLTLSLRNSSSAHTIQLYVESRNFVAGSPGTETNSQVLINESFTVSDGYTKSDFTINNHTLNANSIIYFFFRRTSATPANNIYGVQLDWKFQ